MIQPLFEKTKQESKIWLSSPHMSGREREFVNEAFESNWIAPLGPHVNGFEEDLASYLKEDVHVAATNSGTAALHLALILLNVGKDDEVICQSLTFSASANPIIYQGAVPIFVDSEPDTWNISPHYLETAIKERITKGKKPKAIILVHLYGMPCKMEEILRLAAEYEIPVIEDAAEALGSSYFDRKLGTFGEMSILSFNGNKIITTSGGGAVVSKNKTFIEKSRFLATQARDAAPHYEHTHIGYNYRLSNICAGIGRGQMLVLDERVKKRRQIYNYYRSLLKHIPGISFQEELNGMFSNRWLTVIQLDSKSTPNHITSELIRLNLETEDIESRPVWKPMHLQPVFRDAPYYGEKISENLFKKGLCLPSGSNMSKDNFERVSRNILSLVS
jgi:dTDP-4-amino-4,6-dideoxygalactose transaminase